MQDGVSGGEVLSVDGGGYLSFWREGAATLFLGGEEGIMSSGTCLEVDLKGVVVGRNRLLKRLARLLYGWL